MPMQRNLYPPEWPQIALRLKQAARWTCQRCGAKRGQKYKNRHGRLVAVQIQVAHLDHDPWNRQARLEVMCRACHRAYDASDRRRQRIMMGVMRGQPVLPGLEALYPTPTTRPTPRPARKTTKRPRVARRVRARAMRQRRKVVT